MDEPTINSCTTLVGNGTPGFRQATRIMIEKFYFDFLVTQKTPGVHPITVSGGGMYTKWYIFRSENGGLYFIFRSLTNNVWYWSWRQIRGTIDEPFEKTVIDDSYADTDDELGELLIPPFEGEEGKIDGIPFCIY